MKVVICFGDPVDKDPYLKPVDGDCGDRSAGFFESSFFPEGSSGTWPAT